MGSPGREKTVRDSAVVEISCVTIDCADVERVAGFWNAALRGGGVTAAADGCAVVRVGDGTTLEFIRVTDEKVVKNRVHLGCSIASLRELDAELDRLLELGASLAWEEEFPAEVAAVYRNVVLRDPEGNEFCLGAGTPPT